MNFSALPETNFVGRLLRRILRLIPAGIRVPVLQGPAFGLRWIVGSGNHGCWLGTYEYEKSRLFAKFIHRNQIVYDVGAHVGYYTLIAARRCGEEGRVFSFEPLPRNLMFLYKHVKINGLEQVTIIDKAVGSEDARLKFAVAESGYQGYIANNGQIEVNVTTLDSLWGASGLPAPHIIKIDVEGAEYQVLKGAYKLLQLHYPTIFLSTHGIQIHAQCFDFLTSLSYKLSTVSTSDEILAFHPDEINNVI